MTPREEGVRGRRFLDLGRDGWRPLADALIEVMERGTGAKLLAKTNDHGSQRRAGAGLGGRGTTPDGDRTSAYVAITCADSNLRPGFTGSEKMIKRITAASPVFGEAWSVQVYLCFDWPFDGERATPDVSAEGAAPILVVANTGDPTTPYAGAERMAAELGAGVGVLLTVRDEGHGSYPTTAARPGPSTPTSSTAGRPVPAAEAMSSDG